MPFWNKYHVRTEGGVLQSKPKPTFSIVKLIPNDIIEYNYITSLENINDSVDSKTFFISNIKIFFMMH